MLIRKEPYYYTLGEIVDRYHRYKITANDLIHYAESGKIDIATYIDFDKVTQIEPYPKDTENVPIYSSAIYYLSRSDIIKFNFNSGKDSIIINHIYPNSVSWIDDDFPSPCAEHDISSYPESEWLGDDCKPLLCLIINSYTVHYKDLVILQDDMDFIAVLLKSKTNKAKINSSSVAINAERKTYLLIIKTLSKIIRGEYPDVKNNPKFKQKDFESNLIEELIYWSGCKGFSKRNLQTLFADARNDRESKIPNNTLLLAICALLEMINDTSIQSTDNLVAKLPELEPVLEDTDLQSIFSEAKITKKNQRGEG